MSEPEPSPKRILTPEQEEIIRLAREIQRERVEAKLTPEERELLAMCREEEARRAEAKGGD